jgi:hypothetical protein
MPIILFITVSCLILFFGSLLLYKIIPHRYNPNMFVFSLWSTALLAIILVKIFMPHKNITGIFILLISAIQILYDIISNKL